MESDSFEPRQERRRKVGLGATMRGADGQPRAAAVTDLSETGCRVAVAPGTTVADADVVVRPQGLEAMAGRVRWSHEKEAGIAFASALHPAVVDHLAGDDQLEGAPAAARPGKSGFTDNFGRPLPTLGVKRRR